MNQSVRSVEARAADAVSLLDRPWDLNRTTLVTVAALVPAMAVSVYPYPPPSFLVALGLALAVASGWTWLFARLRGRALIWDCVPTALIFAILVPGAAPLWQQALALTFGVVIGEQIFGGRGRNFLHPAVVALAFLMFSFPGDYQRPDDPVLAIVAGAGGVLLLAARLVSWRVMAGLAIGATASLALSGGIDDWDLVLTGATALGSVFLIGDPVAAASTAAGRWGYGLLAGLLLVVFGHAGGDPGSLRAVIFAALMAGIFAPLIDQIAVWLNVQRRRRRG